MSELISNLDIATYPKIAMVIFFIVFLAITVRTVLMGRRKNVDTLAYLVFEADELAAAEGEVQRD